MCHSNLISQKPNHSGQMEKSKYKSILFILITLLFFACEKEKGELVVEQPLNNLKKECLDGAAFYIGTEYRVQNNVAGKYAGAYSETYSQCIFFDTLKSNVFGWEWNLEGENENPFYPRIEFGWNPWEGKSTTGDLPQRINAISSVVVSFEKKFSIQGFYNSAFDIWITNSDTSSVENRTAEIMIWIDGTATIPGTFLTKSSLSINNELYDLYKNTTWSTIPYIAFVKKESDWSGQLNILPFITYLVQNKHISSNHYLSDVEFGNEIWSGKGTMEIENYRVEIK